ncbi:MAG: response regulator [Planctomycetota bacterium]
MAITELDLAPPGARRRVLVVEDNRPNRTVVRRLLELRGHEVVEAALGEEGLAAARAALFDVVLLDLELPDLDGLEVASALRAQVASGAVPRLVALTGHAYEEARLRCLAGGMDDFLAKPFSPEQLYAAVETAPTPPTAHALAAPTPAAPTPATRPPARSRAPIAREDLVRRLHLDDESLRALAEVAISDCSVRLREAHAALDAQDLSRVRRAAHALKGTLGLLGAEVATRAARRLEGAHDPGDASAALHALDEACELLEPALEELLHA